MPLCCNHFCKFPTYHLQYHVSPFSNFVTCLPYLLQAKRTNHAQVARCPPSVLQNFIQTVLTDQMRSKIQHIGFGGILNIAARSLDDRDFLMWLMDIFDPENMVLAIGGARKIEITEYAIKCVFQIPSKDNDPPLGSDESAKNILADIVLCLFPEIAETKRFKILTKKVATIIHEYNTHGHPKLDDDLCMRLFFMVLTSNSKHVVTHHDSLTSRNNQQQNTHMCVNLLGWCYNDTQRYRHRVGHH
jgi:hypothetical protein